MPVTWKIALRNVREHKTKTIIIGVLITLGVAALVIGNSVMESATEGIRESYIATYTGDFVIAGQSDDAFSLFGGGGRPGGASVPPTIDGYQQIRGQIEADDRVAAVAPQVIGNAIISVDQEQAGFGFMFGIRPEDYRRAFPDNLTLLEGRFLESGEEGIVLNAPAREDLEEASETQIDVGDALLLTGLSQTAGTRIREVEIVGIFEFDTSNAQLDLVSLVDAQTMRALNAMNLSPVQAVELTETEQRIFSDFSEDDLFGGGEDSLFGSAVATDDGTGGTTRGAARSEESLNNLFADAPARPQTEDNAAAWHFLIVRAENPGSVDALISDTEAFLQSNNLESEILSWNEAAGPSAAFTEGIQVALNIGIILIAVVSVIIIMNTLVISVTERVAEIGTMRAIGAHKSFVRRMILTETAILTIGFGLFGVAVGAAVLGLISLLGIEAGNEFMTLVFGGEVLRPGLSAGAVIGSLIGVSIAGLLSSLYPTRIALKIQPVVAMQGK